MSTIFLSLDNPDGVFVPGSLISGTVKWDNLEPNAESLEIRLLWFTRGKGDQDMELIETKTTSSPRTSDQVRFEFQAPAYPNSLSGKLVSLIWAIEAIVFPDHEAENLEIVISPTGEQLMIGNIESGNNSGESTG